MTKSALFSKKSIFISPIGDFSVEILNVISSRIKRIFNCNTQIEQLIENIDFALDENRNQYNSTLIIEKLAQTAPKQALKILAITKSDLFIPILTYVYGEAQLGGKTSIISTHRLNEGLPSGHIDERFTYRIAKEAIHELGHTFELRHCPEHTCIMHYCRGIKDVDQKSNQLCRHCTILLSDQIKRM